MRRWMGMWVLGLICSTVVSGALAQPPGAGGGRGNFGGGAPPLPEELDFEDGVATIPDHKTYQALSYKGGQVAPDGFLAGLEFVKFTIADVWSDKPKLYFINTVNHRGHPMFGQAIGLGRGGGDQMKGVLVYRPRLQAPDGTPGLFTFEFEPMDDYDFEMVQFAQQTLMEKMPLLKGKIGYYPRQRGMNAYQRDKDKYAGSDVRVYLDQDLDDPNVAYLPLNPGQTFGRLRVMGRDERPTARDVVLFSALPNELSRVAGVITSVRQTPLSHVNLRAVQDQVPNAFIANADQLESIKGLNGKYVFYKVTVDGYELREATSDEVESFFADLRPQQPQVPRRDLSVTTIRRLSDVQFADASSVGVKAANLAALRTFGLGEDTVPDGFAVPFYFYDEFMKQNGLYDQAAKMLADPEFQKDPNVQQKALAELQQRIKDAPMPDSMMQALSEMQKSFLEGTSLRLRSSTNNEDLAGFSGAGLYDSFTHKSDEGHVAKSIKQTFASLWNFRAFEEREFYRVDHLATAMGVLVHPNTKGELANGVAVTDDILYDTQGNYYVNVQVGDDLVTNPEAESIPEEILLGWYPRDGHRTMVKSNRTSDGKPVLTDEQLAQLRTSLAKIHAKFAKLYGRRTDERQFAMEIEFKITKDGKLSIKQARPWVFAAKRAAQTTATP